MGAILQISDMVKGGERGDFHEQNTRCKIQTWIRHMCPKTEHMQEEAYLVTGVVGASKLRTVTRWNKRNDPCYRY